MGEQGKKTPRILIVDDEVAVRELLDTLLSEQYVCTTAGSAEEALDYLETEHFDLVVSDINMGGMSGIELIGHVNASSPGTVVMVISGDQQIDSPIESIRSGAFDYLRKPFDIDEVSMAVDRAICHAALLAAKQEHENELERLVAERTEKLNYLAYNDPLTGLSNRASFEETISRATDAPFAVVIVSVDRFSGFRYTLGHTFANRLLIEAGQRLKALSAGAIKIARLEGDEFALLSENGNRGRVSEFAEEVINAFRPPFVIREYEIFVTASVGISLFPADGVDATTLLKHAGAALSYSRKHGGNSFQFYTSDIHETATKRLALQNDLHYALERGELELFYQPKVEISTRRIVGTEALLRWNHPRLGLVSPLDFIPLAEETGLIVPLGEWVIRTACAQTRSWHEAGQKLQVAINLSACQFQQKNLVEIIKNIIAETNFDPAFLTIEVTESSIMHNTEAAVKALGELRAIGIKISIDDFGTGQSSFGYLKHLPIDELKIDKLFIDDITANANGAALVTAIITLAHTLGLRVVAEGIESADQLAVLQALGCGEWQGFHFSRPVNCAGFEQLLASTHNRQSLL